MKKVLAVLLSVMMLFGALSFSSSAASVSLYFEGEKPLVNPNTQVIVTFDLAGGTLKNGQWVYNPSKQPVAGFEWQEGITGTYIMLPQDSSSMVPGTPITLPVVTPPTGYEFHGWYCYGVAGDYTQGSTYAANSAYYIPLGTAGEVIEFRAAYGPAEIEPDTMETVMNILIKVFGTIIGLLFLGDEANPAEAGMQMMSQLLGSLLG